MTETKSRTAAPDVAEMGADRAGEVRVLHIEDNPGDLSLMQEHLRATMPLAMFDDASRIADVTPSRADAADCALLDLSLPDASGLDALLALREMSGRLPIIVLTGFDDLELSLAAVRQGADDYLVKNHIDAYTLERAVRYAIERRSLLRRLDTQIAETTVTEASEVTVGAAMTAALDLLQPAPAPDATISNPRPAAVDQAATAQLDRRSRQLELELQGDSGDWSDHELPPRATVGATSEIGAALAEIRLIVLDDQRRNATLLRMLQLAKRALPGLVDASITVLDGNPDKTVVFTGALAVELDERQFDVGFGPCTDASLTVDAVVVATAEDNPYPHISLAARRAGITHIVSHGLPVAEGVVGALNLYIASATPMDPDTIMLAQTIAGCAAVVVADAGNHRNAPERAARLQEALRIRSTVEQAKGILMVRTHCSSIGAFETLTRVSRRANLDISEVATALVALASRTRS